MRSAASHDSKPSLGWVALVPLVALCLVPACRRQEEEPRLETVDVPPALTVDTADDLQEPERPPELVGVLPADFPDDLPLYLPASLIDFGVTDAGRRSVSLLSSHPRSRVGPQLETLLRQRGWTVGQAEGDGSRRLAKGARKVRLRVEDGRPGTVYRFEY